MELYGQYDKSIVQKIIINLLEILLLLLSYWILFGAGGNWLQEKFSIHNAHNVFNRRLIIMVFNIITFLRIFYMMSFLLKRKINWDESISIPLAFAIYYIGFSWFVLPIAKSLDYIDLIAILLFLTGTTLNTGGEILRDRWKKNPDNSGKIYTAGFFRYSRHINYFGDILWVTAYAIITRNIFAAFIPIFIFSFFAFYNAPKLDSYLKKKYGKAYDEYASKTKMLIPFIF